MRITQIELKNWRNFQQADLSLAQRLFIVGPNAAGKSNFLDAIRFLRDLAIDGGGLQQALKTRGGVSRVRNLAAGNFNHGRVLISATLGDDENPRLWTYRLEFSTEQRGHRRPIVHEETVERNGQQLISRPEREDRDDPDRLTQTYLEQVNANREFRSVAEFFASTRYLHLVPQVIREPDRGADRVDDPFGGDFFSRLRVRRSGSAPRHFDESITHCKSQCLNSTSSRSNATTKGALILRPDIGTGAQLAHVRTSEIFLTAPFD